MSPELFRYRPYSYKSDIWALGCVMYELCNLKNAFKAQSLNDLARKIMKGEYPPIRADYSKELRDLMASMLNTNPKKRPSITEIIGIPIIKKRVVSYIIELCSEIPKAEGLQNVVKQAQQLGIIDLVQKYSERKSVELKSKSLKMYKKAKERELKSQIRWKDNLESKINSLEKKIRARLLDQEAIDEQPSKEDAGDEASLDCENDEVGDDNDNSGGRDARDGKDGGGRAQRGEYKPQKYVLEFKKKSQVGKGKGEIKDVNEVDEVDEEDEDESSLQLSFSEIPEDDLKNSQKSKNFDFGESFGNNDADNATPRYRNSPSSTTRSSKRLSRKGKTRSEKMKEKLDSYKTELRNQTKNIEGIHKELRNTVKLLNYELEDRVDESGKKSKKEISEFDFEDGDADDDDFDFDTSLYSFDMSELDEEAEKVDGKLEGDFETIEDSGGVGNHLSDQGAPKPANDPVVEGLKTKILELKK